MNYRQKNYDEIFMDMLNTAFEEKLISHDDMFNDYIANRKDIENFYVMLLAIHSEALADVYKSMTSVYNSSKIEYATGRDLDDLGLLVGCSRPPATRAQVMLHFTYNKLVEHPITIPEGVIVTGKNGISYKTTGDIEFTPDRDYCDVPAESQTPGVEGRVIAETLTQLVTSITNVRVTNPVASVGGYNAYNDDQYRELLSNWVKINQKGNEWAYKDYFARLDGLEDYKLIPLWDGAGTIKVVVSPSNDAYLNRIYNELQSTVTQASEDIYVTGPTMKPIDIYIDCNVDIDRVNPYSTTDKEIIKHKIEYAIEKYIATLKIGEDFIPLKLAVAIDKEIPEIKNIKFNNPTKPVTILDEEKVTLGNVEVIME